MTTNHKLKILPRFIKRNEDGLAPFQRELIFSINNGKEKIILVEAPVGSGKTYTLRNLLISDLIERNPVIFLYPTKILMESQICSLQKEIGKDKIKVWPYDNFRPNMINLFLYSTDSLVHYAKKEGIKVLEETRSSLLNRLFIDIQWFSRKGGIITSPDVLFLIMKGKYHDSKRIINTLHNSIVIFDEFHCYYGLQGFQIIIEELLNTIANKIILLSATPIIKDSIIELGNNLGGIKYINFDNSKGTKDDICFNYMLDAEIHSFKISDIHQTSQKLRELVNQVELPGAIIFDSVFRLRHIKKNFESQLRERFSIKEWSGMKKDEDLKLNNKTLVFGTSSIEIGIDMKFKTLIMEAYYWPSAIQRLGRVGRKEDGQVHIFTRKDFYPYLKDKKEIDRDEFESILKEAMNDPKEEIGDDYSFRGKNFKFLLYDEDLRESFIYNENLFAMYEIEDFIDNWQDLSDEEKKKILKEFSITQDKIEELLIYDKIFPMWGVLKGKIKNKYDFLSKTDIIFPTEDRNELHIKGYVFYGK